MKALSTFIQEKFNLRESLFFLLILVMLSSCADNTETDNPDIPSDEEIARALQTRLAAVDGVPAGNIQLKVKDGIVRLTGSIDNLMAKKRASEIAESTGGVISVINTLKIAADRPDDAIDKDVNEALSTNPATESWEVNSAVNNGVVTLKGAVDSWQEKQLATVVVSQVRGVKGIDNIILVVDDEDRKDPDIRAEIESMLKFNARIGDEMIKVEVTDGIVNLAGSVGSAAEKQLAVDVAHVAGVEKVQADQLEVRPQLKGTLFRNKLISSLTPAQIEEAIKRSLIYDPRVPAEQIDITIEEGVAILSGNVKNLNSKIAAATDARNTVGVNSVKNNITVKRKVVVKPEVPTTDEAIKSRIESAILRDPYVEETVLTIHVDEGIVELTGTVNSPFEKEHIEEIVTNVKGIISIENQLKINERSNDSI